MVSHVECQELVEESRSVSLTYYLSSILYELYRYRNTIPSSLKINNNDIEKFDYIYQHLIGNPGSQRDKLLNSKKIYIINFLLSEYQYCLSERIQFKDIKHYLKLTIDANPKYKKGLSTIHQGVKVISKIYYQTKKLEADTIQSFEEVTTPPLCYKAKQEIKLPNILCAFQCMASKPLTLNPNVIKNTLMVDTNLANNIFEMFIPDDSLIDDKISISSEEDVGELESLLDEEEGEGGEVEGGFYQYPDGVELEETENVSMDENELLEDNKLDVEEYAFEEYSDGD